MILWHQLLLYLIRNSLNIICVFCFHFIRSRPGIKTPNEREAVAAAATCAITVYSITHRTHHPVCAFSV